MKCGLADVGDTVKLEDAQKLELTITDLKAGYTVTVYNNEKAIYTYTAKKNTKLYMCSVDIEEKGFVRAEITYNLNPAMQRLYKFAESKILTGDTGEIPEFIWAFTNPIWVE